MIKTKFYVHSDVDENNIRADFNNSVDAISYAAGFSPMDKCYVDEVIVDVDDESGEILRELESERIWSFEDLPTEDAFDVNDWPDVDVPEEEMKLETDFDVKDIHEKLEAKEELVECQHCFDLFPKEECTKIEYGYLCPHCHSLVVKEVEIPSEMVDHDIPFELEFPEPHEFDDDGDEDEEIEEQSFQELVADPNNPDIKVNPDGTKTIEGETMMKAFEQGINCETGEVCEPGELKEPEFLNADDYPEETSIAIETPVAFAEMPVTIEGSGLDDSSSDDSEDDSSDELVEGYKGTPEERTTHLEYVDDDPTDGKAVLPKAIDKQLTENLEEHVQDRPAPIEDKTEIHGVDNAVVDCPVAKVIAHCEDEKIDCKMEKPALEEPVAGEEVDVNLYEGIDQELIAYAKSLPEDINDEEILDEGIFGIISDKDVDKKFSQDGYYVIGRNKDGSEKERKDFNHYKDAKNYALNFSKLSDNGRGSVIAKDHGKNTALIQFDNGKEVLNAIKDIFKEFKKEDKVAKADAKAMQGMAKADEKSAEPTEETKVEETTTEETSVAKRDMSKQNEARAQYKKIEKALEILGVNKDVLRDGNKVTQKFKDLRKALFTESYPDMPFDSDVKEGDKIKIIHLEGEDNSYDGKEGTVDHIDSIGQLHGTWGGLAVIPGVDEFEIITDEGYTGNPAERTTHLEYTDDDPTDGKAVLPDNIEKQLTEDKKEEEEPLDSGAIKVEVHSMLNDLVADEIEAIDGYEAVKTELADKPIEHKDAIVHTLDHIKDEEKEHIDELINAASAIPFEKEKATEELEEASSAEKKAYRDGGEAYADYIQGKTIARIKDKDMRDAAVALAKAQASRDAIGRFTGDRKEDQAERAFEKKQLAMANAGMTEDLHRNEEAIVAEWARQGVETGMIFDEGDYDQFAKICKIEGIEPTEDLFKHYFKCIDDLVGVKEVKEESLEFTCDQDLADDRTPTQEEPKELDEPVSIIDTARGEEISNREIKEGLTKAQQNFLDYVETAIDFHTKALERAKANNAGEDVIASIQRTLDSCYKDKEDFLKACKKEESLTEAPEVNYVDYMHSYCNALEPYMEDLKKIEDLEELKKEILDIVEKDPDVSTTEKKNKFIYLIKNKKWASPANLMKYLEMAINKAKGIKVDVDDQGELKEGIEDEEIVACGWCGEDYPKSECRHEKDLGYLCHGCEEAIKSRGETLEFIENEELVK